MFSVEVKNEHHLLKSNTEFNFENFSVLTGPNGSGKSTLLTEIYKCSRSQSPGVLKVAELSRAPFVQLIRSGDLRLIDSSENTTIANSRIESQRKAILKYRDDYLKLNSKMSFELFCVNQGVKHIYDAMSDVLANTGVELEDVGVHHIKTIFTPSRHQENMFDIKLAVMFAEYYKMREMNSVREYQASRGKLVEFYTEGEFADLHGPAPWDLVNEAFKASDVKYRFDPPANTIDILNPSERISVVLRNSETNQEVPVLALSSGEQVILALVMCLYTDRIYGKPDIVLLDEPDASLHPDFSELLVKVLKETLVDKLGIRALMTTHSPSTVALCPDDALFEMQDGVPTKTSKHRALWTLTKNIPHLRVSYESRRQVFVEGGDVPLYQKLFDSLSYDFDLDYQAVFLQPKDGKTNCTDVIKLVSSLNESGGDLARGIIDYDGGAQAKEIGGKDYLSFLGGSRYSIENYILEPIYVMLALFIKSKGGRHCQMKNAGISSLKYNRGIRELSSEQLQQMINYVVTKVGWTIDGATKIKTKLLSGDVVYYPPEFFEMRGHDYEELLRDSLDETVCLHHKQKGTRFMTSVLEVIEEYPEFLPEEILETFQGLK